MSDADSTSPNQNEKPNESQKPDETLPDNTYVIKCEVCKKVIETKDKSKLDSLKRTHELSHEKEAEIKKSEDEKIRRKTAHTHYTLILGLALLSIGAIAIIDLFVNNRRGKGGAGNP